MVTSKGLAKSSAPPSSRWWTACLWGFPPVLATVAHVNTLRNPFVFDDHSTVVTNTGIRDVGNLAEIVRSGVFRPLERLSFAADYALWGLSPVGFHLTNLTLHVVNTVLVFAVALVAVWDSREADGSERHFPGARAAMVAFAAATLFAVHPALTEAVGYVSARGDLLVAMFVMLAVLCARKGFLERQWAWTALSLALFGLGLASKEIAIMFPFVFLAYDRSLLRTAGDARRRLLWFHVPVLALTTLAGAARTAAFLWIENPTQRRAAQRMGYYLLVQFEVVWQYVALFLAPVSLSIFHDVGLSPRRSLVGATALVAVLVVVFLNRRRAPVAAFSVAWFLLLLVPSSSVIPLTYAMAEHRVYVASVGMFVMVGWAFACLLGAVRRWPSALRALPQGALVIGIVALLAVTVARNGVWADDVALWRDAVEKTPRWQTHLALGDALRMQRRCDEAIHAYREALTRAPGRLILYDKLHSCLVDQGRLREAREVEQRLHALDPDFTGRCREMQEFSGGRLSMDECLAGLRRGIAGPRGWPPGS